MKLALELMKTKMTNRVNKIGMGLGDNSVEIINGSFWMLLGLSMDYDNLMHA